MDRAGARRGRRSSGNVVPFPPLARTPPPPRSRFDPRQANLARVVGALIDALGGSRCARSTNLVTGFRASAVDVGRVKTILEAGVAAFDMRQVKARWKRDVFAWMVETTRAWVQRCKLVRLRPRETGIRVELQTQDDEGYYDYGFDVLPGRRRASSRRRRRPARLGRAGRRRRPGLSN